MLDTDDLSYISEFATERGKDDVGVVMRFSCESELYEVSVTLDEIVAAGVECFMKAGAEFTEGKHPGEDVRTSIIWTEDRTNVT